MGAHGIILEKSGTLMTFTLFSRGAQSAGCLPNILFLFLFGKYIIRDGKCAYKKGYFPQLPL